MGELENFKQRKEREKYENTPEFQKRKREQEKKERDRLEAQEHHRKTQHLRGKIAPLIGLLRDCHKDLEKMLPYEYYTGHGNISEEYDLESGICKLTYIKKEEDYKDYKLPSMLNKITGLFNFNDPIESWYDSKSKWWRKEIETTHSFVWEYDFSSQILSCKRFAEKVSLDDLEQSKDIILEYFLTIKKWYFEKNTTSKVVRYYDSNHDEGAP